MSTTPARRIGVLLALLASVAVLPPLGAWWGGQPLGGLLTFPPPRELPPDAPRFAWPGTLLVAAIVGGFFAWWFAGSRRDSGHDDRRPNGTAYARARLPRWGWFALAWTVAWWVVAWTHFPSFEPLQAFTFFPLWLGFIASVNALAAARRRADARPAGAGAWLALFVASAVFWWSFEWLNRFVRNWHYLGEEKFGAAGYAAHASLCFSTVLPAVTAAHGLLRTFPRLQERLARGPRCPGLASRPAAGALFLVGVAGLVLTGAQPRTFYPALWLAPLALLLATSRGPLRREMQAGDWRRAGTWMLAALTCGFFWELWNWHSFPKWTYTVPYVDRWHLFEMPALGYAGYLPFGLECALAIELVLGTNDLTRSPATPPDRAARRA